jgi:hypothetical protein
MAERPAQPPPPSSDIDAHPDADAECPRERYGILAVARHSKRDGRGLMLFTDVADEPT